MVRVFMAVGVVALGLLIYSTVDCIQTPRHKVRVLPKSAWLPIIILLPLLGAGLWLGFGKARGGNGGGGGRRKGPMAPDDDPEFLRNVEFQRRQAQRREEEARRQAEENRRKREAERRAAEKKQEKKDDDRGAGPND
ncbi:PLDc N-terminal domain-containing protein [Nesterenkonia sphaerica]|nr:PLDc N-terminal domain-containing protein [Nesterenkonia sphaerica]